VSFDLLNLDLPAPPRGRQAGTIWRMLHTDAIRPWYYQSWLSIKDPDFIEKASRILDLYQCIWEGEPLGENDFVICADEKSQLQILRREFATLPANSNRPIRFENDYKREGTVAYLSALDVFSGRIFGRVDAKTGIVPFQKLVDLVMGQEPYACADRVFWIVDNGSSHYTTTFPKRLQEAYENAIAVHLPIHASWLNQIEIYFSILQRKALTPNDMAEKDAMEARILGFEERYNLTAKPSCLCVSARRQVNWRFTRQDMEDRMAQLERAA
jgi:hypothetical protein